MTVFLVVSSLYPNGHYLRPHSFEHDNVFTHMVAWLYATDTPTNLFPSIHVYNSLGVHIAICNSKEFKDRPKLKLASFILMVSIILATMLHFEQQFFYFKCSISSIQIRTDASLGILKSPLGDTATVPTFGPSGKQERLNCCEKKRR